MSHVSVATRDVLDDSRLRRSRVPLHYQIQDYVLGLVQDGTLTVGAQVPTEAELMSTFGVSRTTVRQALQRLEAAGVVYRQRGLGTFVSEPRLEQDLVRLTGFVEDMAALGRSASARVVEVASCQADSEVANALQMVPGEVVVNIKRVRLADGEPISFDDTYLPTDLGEKISQDDLTVEPIFDLLERKYGIALVEATYTMQASGADRNVARHLGVRAGAPILLIRRLTTSHGGRPVDYERLYYRGEGVRYRLHLRR